jgi:hypothetical protein
MSEVEIKNLIKNKRYLLCTKNNSCSFTGIFITILNNGEKLIFNNLKSCNEESENILNLFGTNLTIFSNNVIIKEYDNISQVSTAASTPTSINRRNSNIDNFFKRTGSKQKKTKKTKKKTIKRNIKY